MMEGPIGRNGARRFLPAPDVGIEIVSPRQGVRSQARKCQWYVSKGVQLALVIDPDDCSVRLLHPAAGTETLHGNDAIDLGVILIGLQLSARELFGMLLW